MISIQENTMAKSVPHSWRDCEDQSQIKELRDEEILISTPSPFNLSIWTIQKIDGERAHGDISLDWNNHKRTSLYKSTSKDYNSNRGILIIKYGQFYKHISASFPQAIPVKVHWAHGQRSHDARNGGYTQAPQTGSALTKVYLTMANAECPFCLQQRPTPVPLGYQTHIWQ